MSPGPDQDPPAGDSQSLIAVIEEAMRAHGWEYRRVPGRSEVVTFVFHGDDERWSVFGEAQDSDVRIVFYSVVPFNVPEECRSAVTEFITRANYGLIIGNFELDLDDGEVRFKTSIDGRGAHISPELVDRALVMNLHATNTYLPGITQLVGDETLSPAEVLVSIEART